MVSIHILSLVFGAVYGFIRPGKEDKIGLLKKGLLIGIVFGIIVAIINVFRVGGLILVGGTFVGVIIEILSLTIMFVIGAFIGDFLEGILKK